MDSADEEGHELPQPPSIKLCLDLRDFQPQHLVQAFHLKKIKEHYVQKGAINKDYLQQASHYNNL